MSKFNNLFEPFIFNKGITLKNRVVMSPMTTWSSNDDYTISDEEVAYYKKRVNGVGLVITGCTHVLPNGIGFTHEFAAYNDSFIPSLKKLADAAKSGGAPAILQLFHAGDKAIAELVPNGDVVSPSGVALTEAVSLENSSMKKFWKLYMRSVKLQDVQLKLVLMVLNSMEPTVFYFKAFYLHSSTNVKTNGGITGKTSEFSTSCYSRGEKSY